jgi:murein DD-endopeptidase MepM/ murein hydrolase activator NlpD
MGSTGDEFSHSLTMKVIRHQLLVIGSSLCLLPVICCSPVYPQETSEKALDQYESQLEQDLWQQETLSGQTDQLTPHTPFPTPQFIYPAQGILTSNFGWRWGRLHQGIDIAGPTGTPIVAAAKGTVQFSGWNSGGYGYLVEVRHSDGSLTRYAHNSRVLVSRGEWVEQGQAIALMGSTGFSTGPHCHFEIHPAGKGAVNPLAYLGKKMAQGL